MSMRKVVEEYEKRQKEEAIATVECDDSKTCKDITSGGIRNSEGDAADSKDS